MSQLNLTKIGRVAVPTDDSERSLQFYRDTLGFEVQADETFADGQMRWIEVTPAGGGTAIAIAPPPPGKPTAVETGIIIESKDIEADHATLKDAGIDVDPEIARYGPPVPPMFWFRDPSGNSLMIVEPTQ